MLRGRAHDPRQCRVLRAEDVGDLGIRVRTGRDSGLSPHRILQRDPPHSSDPGSGRIICSPHVKPTLEGAARCRSQGRLRDLEPSGAGSGRASSHALPVGHDRIAVPENHSLARITRAAGTRQRAPARTAFARFLQAGILRTVDLRVFFVKPPSCAPCRRAGDAWRHRLQQNAAARGVAACFGCAVRGDTSLAGEDLCA